MASEPELIFGGHVATWGSLKIKVVVLGDH
jgi:hypothetical protein